MEVQRLDDPRAFLEAITPFLVRDEARHNLLFGILQTLIRHPAVYPAWHLWLVEDDGDVAGAAMQTPPHNLLLAQPRNDTVLDALADAIHAGGAATLPGVSAVVPEALDFGERWTALTGATTRTRMRQGVYALAEVHDVARAAGAARVAVEADLDLISAWTAAFAEEVEVGVVHDPDQRRRLVAARLASRDESGFWLWEDGGEAVSLTGYGRVTPNGARVGPVYTPPELRGRGYATTIVADASSWLLATGATFCFLYTDLANPTSNAIYRRIGYDQVFEAVDLAFERA